MNKTEVGIVHYLTLRLMFPQDKDEWIQQRPIPASTVQGIFFFIGNLKLSQELKSKLFRELECSWKDDRGVWHQLRIETTHRRDKWGNLNDARKIMRSI